MVNEQKVILMTKAAVYEKDDGKDQIPLSEYYKNDFIKYNCLKTIVFTTIGFALVCAAFVLSNIEYILDNLNHFPYIKIGIGIMCAYLICLTGYGVVSRIVSVKRFESARKGLNQYNHYLKQLSAIYKEETENGTKAMGQKGASQEHDEFISF